MALPASKRRKLEHYSSDESETESSFASFGQSDEEGVSEPSIDEDEFSDSGRDENTDEGEDVDGVGESQDEETGKGTHMSKNGDPSSKDQEGNQQQSASSKVAGLKRSSKSNGTTRPLVLTASSTTGTFRSNAFKLQLDELLENLRPRHRRREMAAEEALRILKLAIEQIPSIPAKAIDEAERDLVKASKVVIPFPDPRPPRDAKYKLEYMKPTAMNVVGSYALKTYDRLKHPLKIDMVVQMPSEMFQDKDYLNFRYFYKRAYYLACIAAELKSHFQFDTHFALHHDDVLKPIIVVGPKSQKKVPNDSDSVHKWQINVMPHIADERFPIEKLEPQKNCIRSAATASKEVTGNLKLVATPRYNSSLRSDMLMSSYLKLLHSSANSCESYRDACLLGETWLSQRGMGSSIATGGFGTFEWSATMALLLQGGGPNGKPVLSASYGAHQLVKATFQVLATRDMSKQPLIVGRDTRRDGGNLASSPVLWDGIRSHNILYKMSPWSGIFLRQEAKTAVAMLSDPLFDGFEATFITNLKNPLLRYDIILNLPEARLQSRDSSDSSSAVNSWKPLHDTLSRGLGDRMRLVNITPATCPQWPVASARPKASSSSARVGIIVNADAAHRAVDHGPSVESKVEAASFREFWGEKSELRRFKDGRVLESIVWDDKSDVPILEQILRYLVAKHYGVAAEQGVLLSSDGFARLLRHKDSMLPFQSINEAYRQLENDIRNLEGLPLAIRQMMPADSQLRFASIHPFHPMESLAVPAAVTLQFEGSGRWPDDLVAIQRTKIAFLLKMCELLAKADSGVDCRIGLENECADAMNQGFLELTYGSGISFRLRIYHDREQTLLEKQLKDKSLDPRSKELAALGLATYKRNYLRTPMHTQAIARLCNRFPPLSGTMRLIKKWFASHLLANHFSDEILELMAARAFVQPWPYQAPSSVQTGFLRTLAWLSKWDWRVEPLIVDIGGSSAMKIAEFQSIQTRFEAWRKLDPAMNRVCLFAASSVDPDGTTYTNGRPTKVVAGRMTSLAAAACLEVADKQLELEIPSLFSSPFEDFDFVIHMSSLATNGRSNARSQSNGTFKNLDLAILDNTTLRGLDTTSLFLEELERCYGPTIVFFCGREENPVIAGLWSPQTASRNWKVNLAYSTMPIKANGQDQVQAEPNKLAMLSEMSRLGGDLVDRIEVYQH